MIAAIVLMFFGFFAGAVPFGVLIANWLGVDIRDHGSGNIGATNVTRVLGKGPGAIVLGLDALKGALPTYFAIRYTGDPWTVVATGGMAIVGHCFSPFLEFRGGKGVATAMGVFLVLAPQVVLVAIAVFGVILALTRVPALGSLAGAAVIAGLLVRAHDTEAATLAVLTFLLLLFTHRGNLARVWVDRRTTRSRE